MLTKGLSPFLALSLAVGLAAAESIHVRGPAEVDAPKPEGALGVTLSIYDAAEGGRLLWRSPSFAAEAKGGRWLFSGVRGAADRAAVLALPTAVYVQFQSGDTVFKPRQLFHRSDATAAEAAFSPGRAPTRLPSDEDGEGVEVGGGRVQLLAVEEARPSPAPAPDPAREPSLDDIRQSNDLFFQALREYRTGNVRLALAKLEVALKWNPGNAEARIALERVRNEHDSAPPARGPAPRPEAVRAAQELYFEALRHYGHGRLRQCEAALVRAAQTDPTDAGISSALIRLRREMLLMPNVVH
ncbi:MAG: hypothetical protein HY553_10985 [Elusimicrobia bacterium]|nr:hypothetical protein [Elusimicrobiota bacterium]